MKKIKDFIEKREEKFRKRPKNMRIEVLLSKLRPKIVKKYVFF